MKHRSSRLVVAFCAAFGATVLSSDTQATAPQVDDDGTVHVPAYVLPESALLGPKTREVLGKERVHLKNQANPPQRCPPWKGAHKAQMPTIRKCEAEAFYKTVEYKHLRELYRVTMTPKQLGGVYTEVFEPVDGIVPKNQNRVLINVHGGSFLRGARTESHSESVPISAVGRIKVVSIDYRQGPEFSFPAASEDVTAVYRELLKTYKPANIGLYGCSAGGLLTAEAIAWFEKEKLPLPGAAGMLCAAGAYWTEGDSGSIAAAHGWWGLGDTITANPYFEHTDPNDPLAFPARSAQVLARFPPSLLIASTRDVALSSVVYTHSVLVAQGVDADLHIWEGLLHGFFLDPDLPQSQEVYAVIVKFFDTHLGT